MSHHQYCCAAGVCCPGPENAQARVDALAGDMIADLKLKGAGKKYAAQCAEWVLAHFDLAPQGSTESLLKLWGPWLDERAAQADGG